MSAPDAPALPVAVSPRSAPLPGATPPAGSVLRVEGPADGLVLSYPRDSGLPVAAQVGVVASLAAAFPAAWFTVLEPLVRRWADTGAPAWFALLLTLLDAGLLAVAAGAGVRLVQLLKTGGRVEVRLLSTGWTVRGAAPLSWGRRALVRSAARTARTREREDGAMDVVVDGADGVVSVACGLAAEDARFLVDALTRYGDSA